jgi:hypothetical protein
VIPAVVMLVLAVVCVILVGFVLITGKTVTGGITVKGGKSEVQGTEVGVLLAAALVLAIVALFKWPQSPKGPALGAYQPVVTPTVATSPPPTSPTLGAYQPVVTPTVATSLPPTPPTLTSTPPLTSPPPVSVTQQTALDFLGSFLQAMASPTRTESDLPNWFVFPVDFYGAKDLTDQGRLFAEYTPKAKDPAQKKTYSKPVPVGFDPGSGLVAPGSGLVTLYVRVDWATGGGDSGSVRVKYGLIPSAQGHPYRIRSIQESNI